MFVEVGIILFVYDIKYAVFRTVSICFVSVFNCLTLKLILLVCFFVGDNYIVLILLRSDLYFFDWLVEIGLFDGILSG
ncbi:hypothetical protein TUM4261_19740 [Shewanella sp. c952]|nr:hypothetical protein TUM4261_19740 [Shewanella sp. c952]